MEIVPILNTFRRSKTAVSLMLLQIGLTLAITCNAVSIIHDRLTLMGRPTGMDMDDIFYVSTTGYAPDYAPADAIRTYLDLLRRLPGVVDATPAHQLPLSGGWSREFRRSADLKAPAVDAGVMHLDEHGLVALGLKLVEGRDFTALEVQHTPDDAYRSPPVVIVTRAMAEALFPGQEALGKTVYVDEGDRAETIIGIVDRLQGFWPHWEGFERTVIMPTVFENRYFCRFLVRTLPGERDQVMQDARRVLDAAHTGAYVRSLRSLDDYRDNTYQDDRAMAAVLCVVTGLILGISALGMAGLASFSVRRRTRQIGTRRALGARRIDIVRYFLTENWLITSLGALLGCLLAVALNLALVHLYDLPPLAWYYLPLGVLCLWSVGLLASLGPALKAADIPPAIATRSV